MVQLAADDAGNAETNARYEKALQKYARNVRCPLQPRVKRLNTESQLQKEGVFFGSLCRCPFQFTCQAHLYCRGLVV